MIVERNSEVPGFDKVTKLPVSPALRMEQVPIGLIPGVWRRADVVVPPHVPEITVQVNPERCTPSALGSFSTSRPR